LQLYLPWRDEDELMHCKPFKNTYEQSKQVVEINRQIFEPHANIDYDDLEDDINLTSSSDSDDNEEYSFMDPTLLECTDDVDNVPHNPSDIPYRQTNLSLPNDIFYDMCATLNIKQRDLLNYIIIWCHLNLWSDECIDTQPFYTFLSGGAGVGKSHLIKVIAEYCKRVLKRHGQNLEQPSIMLTASTGKAASGIDGITLHSAFRLPVKSKKLNLKQSELQTLQIKYKFLKIIVIDEISMVNYDTFEFLSKQLQLIFENDSDFGGISVIACGDFLQLPPVYGQPVFAEPAGPSYSTLAGSLWKRLFKLHELTEIVRQASDPEFAGILSRIREGKQTQDDMDEIMALHGTDISSWPAGFIKLYMTNRLAEIENKSEINKLLSRKIIIRAKDSRRDRETGVCEIDIPDSLSLCFTAGLPSEVQVCVGARFMLTINLKVEDKLINGSIGTIVHLQLSNQYPLNGIIFVKFDNPNAGNSLKNSRLPIDLRDCVPIKSVTRDFLFKSKKGRCVSLERRQYPGILAHAITIHKSQGSTYEYMLGNMDTTSKGKKAVGVQPGQAYTLLSRAQNRERLALKNFNAKMLNVNEPALEEMERLRKYSMFVFKHPLEAENDCLISLLNIRSWNLHIDHFLTDPNFVQKCCIFCFTETNISDSEIELDSFDGNWVNIHKSSSHGLAFCYNRQKIQILREYDINGLEAMAFDIQYKKDTNFIIMLVYRMPGAVHNFVERLTDQVRRLPIDKRIILLGDFNLDQRDGNNVDLFSEFREEFSFSQRSNFTTHTSGGILDLVFDNRNSTEVSFMPTPFSDHFIITFDV
jgi:hypothetical protein